MTLSKLILATTLLFACAEASTEQRIKDLAQVGGFRTNQLVGYGLVVGLDGTGDGTQARFTIQSLANLLRRSGVQVPESAIRVRNVCIATGSFDHRVSFPQEVKRWSIPQKSEQNR